MIIYLKTNVTNLNELNELNKYVVQDLGPVTILVNNAGLLMHKNPLNPEPEDIQRMIDVNFTSHYWVSFNKNKCDKNVLSISVSSRLNSCFCLL